jgi:hypothetical protein
VNEKSFGQTGKVMIRDTAEFDALLKRMDAWEQRKRQTTSGCPGVVYEPFDAAPHIQQILAEIQDGMLRAVTRYRDGDPPLGAAQVDLVSIVREIHQRHPDYVVTHCAVKAKADPTRGPLPFDLELRVVPRYRS